MKTAIIKGLFGSYDFWVDPRIVEDDVDYHVFTDQNIKSKVYTIHKTNRTPKIERLIKIETWKYLPGYDRYIWLDSNMHPKAPMPSIPEADIVCLEHPARDCVYEEFLACVRLRKDDERLMAQQVNGYLEEGYPEKNGMAQTGLLIRTPTDEVKEHARLWAEEVKNKSRRDQLSFNYCLWQMEENLSVFTIKMSDFEQYYKLVPHKR